MTSASAVAWGAPSLPAPRRTVVAIRAVNRRARALAAGARQDGAGRSSLTGPGRGRRMGGNPWSVVLRFCKKDTPEKTGRGRVRFRRTVLKDGQRQTSM